MKVAFIMGSDSDLPVVEPGINVVKEFGIETVVRVISAHRTPEAAKEFAVSAKADGIEVIVSAAGMAAHLGGVLASYTTLPVIGLPIKAKDLGGVDALLATIQMPPGIPVATVGINAGKNAGLLAVQMLSLKHEHLQDKLLEYRKDMATKVEQKDKEIQVKFQ